MGRAPTKVKLKRAELREKDALELRSEALALVAKLQAELKATRARLRPVLAYFGEQWVGDRVRKEYRELVQFVKEGGDE